MYMGNSHNTIMIYDDISLIQKSLEKLSMNFEKKYYFVFGEQQYEKLKYRL